MCYETRDFLVDENSDNLFLKKTRPDNIYNIFVKPETPDEEELTKKKYKYHKIQFHFNRHDGDVCVGITKYYEHTLGRTFYSTMRDFVNYLIKEWNINDMGHFKVCFEKE